MGRLILRWCFSRAQFISGMGQQVVWSERGVSCSELSWEGREEQRDCLGALSRAVQILLGGELLVD